MGEAEKKVAVGIMPVALGQTELKSRDDRRSFYLRESGGVKELSIKEIKKRDNLDSMRKFSERRKVKNERKEESSSHDQHNDDEEKRRHRKRRKKSKQDDERKWLKTSKSGRRSKIKGDNLQELRRRRQEREASESIRASALFAGRKQDEKKRAYQNQYNP